MNRNVKQRIEIQMQIVQTWLSPDIFGSLNTCIMNNCSNNRKD